jgi:hypothetical protein
MRTCVTLTHAQMLKLRAGIDDLADDLHGDVRERVDGRAAILEIDPAEACISGHSIHVARHCLPSAAQGAVDAFVSHKDTPKKPPALRQV